MTYCEAFGQLKRQLQKAGCDSPAFDAIQLLEAFAEMPRKTRPSADALPPGAWEKLKAAANRRAAGEPLQYILGEWDFLTLTLSMGKGVLIPGPDTEVLCETAANKLRGIPFPQVLDLCAGSGCVGLGVCSLLPSARVTAVELSDAAFGYLSENIRRYPQYTVCAVKDDVLCPRKAYPNYDAILCNPPYIPTGDIPALMREVRAEPVMALDGGADGLRFYRPIGDIWALHLKPGGWLAVEVGLGQAQAVADIFRQAGLRDIGQVPDAAGILRVVTARRP